ncbi:MAG: vWA domain-containing protein [bacterium]
MAGGRLSHSVARILALVALVAALPVYSVSGQTAQKPKSDAPQVISSQKFSELQGRNTQGAGSSSASRPASHLSTSFYGIQAEGDTFVFVIDNSTSMLDGGRLAAAHSALNAAIRRLKFPQKFYILAFDASTLAVPWGPFISAQSADARKVAGWLARLTQKDGTLPGPALRQAIGLNPSAVFFLTDGQFDDPTPAQIKSWNTFKVPVHVIDLGPASESSPTLRQIASDSGGVYRRAR